MRALLVGAVATAGITAVVHTLQPFPRFVVAELGVFIIVVLSLNVLMGVVGLTSLATAAFMGIGGYVMLILVMQFHVPLLVAIAGGVFTAAIAGWLLGLVSLRLAGLSLAIVTFGFVQIFVLVVREAIPITGGGYGLIVPPLDLPGVGRVTLSFLNDASVFLTVAIVTLTWTMTRSRVGRAWFAIKDNEVAAEVQGVNVGKMKTLAFATTSAMASIAGAIQVLLLGVISPNSYTIDASITHLSMVVVGGISGSVTGAVLGPVALFLLPEYFHFLGSYREVLYGGLLLTVLVLLPNGLAGVEDRLFAVARHLAGRGRVVTPRSR